MGIDVTMIDNMKFTNQYLPGKQVHVVHDHIDMNVLFVLKEIKTFMIFELNTLIYIVIPVIHRNYDVNDAMTANIHVVIPVIDRNYDINDVVTGNHAKSREF